MPEVLAGYLVGRAKVAARQPDSRESPVSSLSRFILLTHRSKFLRSLLVSRIDGRLNRCFILNVANRHTNVLALKPFRM